MLTQRDLGWIAGFLEGEGSFVLRHNRHRYRSSGSVVVSAGQIQRQPLHRLVALLGGKIYVRAARARNPHIIYHWQLHGAQARGLMMTLYALMSVKRQLQIRTALDGWRAGISTGQPNHLKTHCPRGHPYDAANTILSPLPSQSKVRRVCRECWNAYRRRRRAMALVQ